MQVSLEAGEGLERKLTIQVPADTIDKEVESRLNSMKSRVRVDGFRPGKVPLKIVKQQYGAQVLEEVAGEVMQNSFRDAVIQENLKPAGMPSIETRTLEMGKPLEYVATFEVYPEVELADFSSLEIEKVAASVEDADVDNMIETLRKQRMSYESVDRASQDKDQITISFEGFVDDVAFEGGKADNVPVVLGSGSMIPGFEEALVGKKAGDDFSFDVTFPEDYQAENLKGKLATFKTQVASVAEPKLPEVDEDFIKSFGIDDGDLEKLKGEIRKNMERELSSRLSSTLKNNVMDAVLKANDFSVPKALVDEEARNLQKRMTESGNLQGGMTLPLDIFEGEARRRVSLGLLIGEVIKSADLKVDQGRVSAKIDEIASSYEDPEEVVKHYRANPELMQSVEALVMEEMAVEWITDQAKVTEKQVSFDDIMNPDQAKADQ